MLLSKTSSHLVFSYRSRIFTSRSIHHAALLRQLPNADKPPTTDSDQRRRPIELHKYRAPRNTIVLCHGLLGFDVMGPKFLRLHYWRGIQEALTAIGARVIVTRVPRVSDVSVRAQVLLDSLEEKVPEGHSINLVGHSMGGLDCRYMISHLLKQRSPKFRVNSLTTIGTPHRGSSIASFPFISTLLEPLIATLYRSTSLDVRAFTGLTPSYLKDVFNPETPDDPAVAYFSYGADGTESVYEKPIFYPLRFTFEYLMAVEGPNDGLVSVESAHWGDYIRTLQADHIDLINLFNAWKWEAVVTSMDAVEKVQDALNSGRDPSGRPLKDYERSAMKERLRDAKQDLENTVNAKAEDLKREMQETKFNAIELYLEIATMLANKGF